MKWNRTCPICKREIGNGRFQDPGHSSNEETASSTEAVVANNVLPNNNAAENIPLLVPFNEFTDSQTNRYGSVAENNDERFSDQPLLESTVHTNEPYNQLRSSENSDGLPDTELYHSVTEM